MGDRPRKFKKGQRIKSIHGLIARINDGEWIMLNGKPKQPEVMRNMSLATLEGFVMRRVVHIAERNF